METLAIDSERKFLKSLPQLPGVYLFKNKEGKILYTGKSVNIRSRVESYFSKDAVEKVKLLTSEASKLSFILTDNEIDALILEANLIKKYLPHYNVVLKDDKSYPYLKITVKEKIPRILVARKIEMDGNLYFGPYPSSQTLYSLLRFLRHAFPYCTHSKPYKSCLYVHLGLCPCPGENITRQKYLGTINLIRKFLEGKKTQIIKLLEKELKNEVARENFEEAGKIKKQIDYILNFKSYKKESPYDENYELKDLRIKELNSLISTLKNHGINISSLERIEAYDISNTSGRNSTASMVVLINGTPDNSMYKRFRIQLLNSPNDYAMLAQTMERRIKHEEWGIPDLIIIDGGEGQLGVCATVVKKWKKNIVCIGLAKRLETIILESGEKINLKLDDPGLHVLQRARDEAHRFARKYHRLLRSKNFLS